MLWIKGLHIISMVAWFAGLFYLPRLFVYHSDAHDRTSIERFKIMERRLFFAITNPAMVATLAFGIWMLYGYAWTAYSSQLWLQIKLVLIVGLLVYHYFCFRWLKAFAQDENQHTSKFFRIVNEIPTVFLVAIVLLASVRPI